MFLGKLILKCTGTAYFVYSFSICTVVYFFNINFMYITGKQMSGHLQGSRR